MEHIGEAWLCSANYVSLLLKDKLLLLVTQLQIFQFLLIPTNDVQVKSEIIIGIIGISPKAEECIIRG